MSYPTNILRFHCSVPCEIDAWNQLFLGFVRAYYELSGSETKLVGPIPSALHFSLLSLFRQKIDKLHVMYLS